ncbi:hypothetical protein F183_A41950 [Bryobacterales bacterium F-183]|nr:hypothetical protein F183_A41950 [Bryobacterales bacterium F-183]
MSRLEVLQNEIEQLNDEELRSLREWFAARDFDEWDRQMERDAKAGKLDRLAEQALRDHASGRSTKL